MADPRSSPDALFAAGARTLVGVIHLPRLLAHGAAARAEAVLERAVADATAYADAGFDAVLVENHGDSPFEKDRTAPAALALVALAARAAGEATGLPVGVNLLRNDAVGALAACHAADGAFVRVNVLTGVSVTDQGLIEGAAARVHEERRRLGRGSGPGRIRILADVDVKHAAPLVPRPLDLVAEETVQRGGADGLLVTGPGTGRAAQLDEVARVRRGAPDVPVWVASGVTADNVADVLEQADGAIVGTAAKRGGVTDHPVDVARARAIAASAGRA